eukprot:670585-Pleurochrysis_carterae.AAC.1
MALEAGTASGWLLAVVKLGFHFFADDQLATVRNDAKRLLGRLLGFLCRMRSLCGGLHGGRGATSRPLA